MRPPGRLVFDLGLCQIPHFSNVVEDDQPGLYRRLRELLSHDAKQSGVPLIVLVHDEDMARGIISRAGIDLASWSSGLTSLLPIVAPQKVRHRRCIGRRLV